MARHSGYRAHGHRTKEGTCSTAISVLPQPTFRVVWPRGEPLRVTS